MHLGQAEPGKSPEALRPVRIKAAGNSKICKYCVDCFILKISVSAFILLECFGMRRVLVTGECTITRGMNQWPILVIVASKQGLSMAEETQDEAFPPQEVQACSGVLHAFCCPSACLCPLLSDSEASCSPERNWLRFGCCASLCCLQGSVCSKCLLCLYSP